MKIIYNLFYRKPIGLKKTLDISFDIVTSKYDDYSDIISLAGIIYILNCSRTNFQVRNVIRSKFGSKRLMAYSYQYEDVDVIHKVWIQE